MNKSKLNVNNFTRVPTTGELISCHPKVDKRQKDTRKRKSAEPKKRKVSASKKKKETQICRESIVREV